MGHPSNLISQTGTTPNLYLFAGEQYDSALGVYYNRARYLNTNTGRFWTVDTFEGDPHSPLSLHKYVYAVADPVNEIDRDGHELSLGEQTAVVGISTTMAAMSISAMALLGRQVGQHKPPDAILVSPRGNLGAGGFAGGIGVDVYLGLHGQGIWFSPVLEFGLSPLTLFKNYSMIHGNIVGLGITAGFSWAEMPTDLEGLSFSAVWPKRAFNSLISMLPGNTEPFATLGYLAKINQPGVLRPLDWVAVFSYSPGSQASSFQIGLRANSFAAMAGWDTGYMRLVSADDLGPFGDLYNTIMSLVNSGSSPESLLGVIQ